MTRKTTQNLVKGIGPFNNSEQVIGKEERQEKKKDVNPLQETN